MKRINIFLSDYQIKFLKDLGRLSEHVRYAIEDYIYKIQRERVSASKSKRKAGDGDGSTNTDTKDSR